MNIDNIIASVPNKSAAERAQMRKNAENWRDRGTASQKAAAEAFFKALSAAEEAEHATLYDSLTGLGVAERVVRAFTAIPMTDTERKVIQALLDYPGSTSTALSGACGWKGKMWHLRFGTLCKERGPYLWPAPRFESKDAFFYSGTLADTEEPANLFTMKPEVAAAFASMGIRPSSGARTR